jgi:hypothetical protein
VTIVKLAMAALFAYSAWIQGNDPDPGLWIVLYGLAAFATLSTLFDGANRPLTVALPLVVLAIAFSVRVLGVTHWHVNDEAFREAGGLAIASAWLGYLWFSRR